MFNHSCYDDCNKEIDKNTPCYKILEYGCDCGKNKCWQNNQCIAIKNLKKKKYKTYKIEKKPKQQITKPTIENKNFSGFIDNISKSIKSEETLQCQNAGGKIKNFRNNCADNCNITRDTVCAPVITKSCDCGPGKCWDKTKCINQ